MTQLRTRQENIILLGLMPGTVPKPKDMNACLAPIIEALAAVGHPGSGVEVRCAVCHTEGEEETGEKIESCARVHVGHADLGALAPLMNVVSATSYNGCVRCTASAVQVRNTLPQAHNM